MSQQGNSTRKAIGWVLFIAGGLLSGCLLFNLVSLAATGGTSALGRVEAMVLMVLGCVMFVVGSGLAFGKPRQPK